MEPHVEPGTGSFFMADIRSKRPTRRRAVAVGEIAVGAKVFTLIVERRLPKGDALAMAEMAGLQGTKLASQLMPLCHPLTLEMVRLRTRPVPERHVIRVYCEVATEARTGVEMEALAGVNAALLTLYDLSKPIEPALTIGAVRLLFKEGGKRGLWRHPDGMDAEEIAHYRPSGPPRLDGVRAAVLTLSDRASSGGYEDRSGPVLVEGLRNLGAELGETEVLSDDPAPLIARLRALAGEGVALVLCTGGTGLGPRDHAPEALEALGGRDVPGLAEMFRMHGSFHTPLAWLSRARAVQLDDCLVLALPGSPRAVAQAFDILAPVLAHALAMAAGKDHP
jgi:cyclic pyranopterin monophosphate synthase